MTGKDDQKTADKVREIVHHIRMGEISPDKLVDYIVMLAAACSYLSVREAEAHAKYLDAERHRKHDFAVCKLERMAAGASATKAEALAEADDKVVSARQREINAQAERMELKGLLDGARDVMDAARTKVSWLKNERNNTHGT